MKENNTACLLLSTLYFPCYNKGMENKAEWRPLLSVRIFTGRRKGFGPGIARLLREVQTRGSLRAAAISMDMAYSKAWRILNESERALGFPLLARSAGGKSGGGAALTEEGQRILEAYEAYTVALERHSEQLFAQYFAGATIKDGCSFY